MPKSKHRKGHKQRVAKYKSEQKIVREVLKKKMIEDFIKNQQEILGNKESHTSTKDVVGPEIDIDSLNDVEDLSNELDVPEIDINELEGNIDNIIDTK